MLESRRNLVLACALSGLAGYVDGIGYLHLGGPFVSFMSGNSTRLGVSLSEAQWDHALEAFVLIVLFVAGAAVGSLIVLGRIAIAHRQPLILLAEAVLLRLRLWPTNSACRTSRLRRSWWRWGWRTPYFS
ncbi:MULTISPECIES: DUF1275 family protein [unclassified Bradyrhizobium]|uniref:YoaK family protein n=1 Tax=unclassified Bradyrhizobium TaxID=2631580 RepID=UPI00247AE1FE|nr:MULTISPECIES: DUF1275 family protein [unclassified Bradyrhizobium]